MAGVNNTSPEVPRRLLRGRTVGNGYVVGLVVRRACRALFGTKLWQDVDQVAIEFGKMIYMG